MITKTSLCFDLPRLLAEYEKFSLPWNHANQIAIVSRPGVEHPIYDGVGTSVEKTATGYRWLWREEDFTQINEPFRGTYFDQVCRSVGLNGRIRLMRQAPRACYSIHQDPEKRWHMGLITNPDACFLEVDKDTAKIHRIPADGHVYDFDSYRWHTALNPGLADRIHIVFNRWDTCVLSAEAPTSSI